MNQGVGARKTIRFLKEFCLFSGSKAVGEQSFLMGCSTIFALRRAIDSIRNDQGENPMPFYKLGL